MEDRQPTLEVVQLDASTGFLLDIMMNMWR
nr:MAG TPA: hypothetical protein [Caudoviricetes sp.]